MKRNKRLKLSRKDAREILMGRLQAIANYKKAIAIERVYKK